MGWDEGGDRDIQFMSWISVLDFMCDEFFYSLIDLGDQLKISVLYPFPHGRRHSTPSNPPCRLFPSGVSTFSFIIPI